MAYSKPGYIFQQKCCADWCLKSCLGPIVSKNNLCQIQKLPYVLYRYRYRIRLEGKSSIGIDIEFEKKEQLANIRFRTQTNVYRTTMMTRLSMSMRDPRRVGSSQGPMAGSRGPWLELTS